ncbi:sugar phosphate isomerase/epimerase family protein [Amycolatopsis benzoatilytica]|uniref:sugar phosphate isomerase/epimerase family protein n=1 Tax=Amycolatopsis benzoatilytica TaxID=346045 RepID=UPI000554FE6A|nr:sugar phosphate isomerase/epimerase family protein [Amycolatopsis benzoatilytica]
MGLSLCSLNSATIKHASFSDLIALAVHHGFGGVGLWRDSYAATGAASAARLLAKAGLRVTSVCRGGAFPQPSAEARAAVREDNLRALDEAHALGADCLVLVCGPAIGRDLEGARRQIEDGIADLIPRAASAGVPLAVEPMHPMMAADRSAVTSLAEANDLLDRLDSEWVSLCLDSYHLWWDAALPAEVARAAGRVSSVQLADWILPIEGQLSSRGMPGEGTIDLAGFVELVAGAGYPGLVEVEVLSDRWWSVPPADAARAAADGLHALSLHRGAPSAGPSAHAWLSALAKESS